MVYLTFYYVVSQKLLILLQCGTNNTLIKNTVKLAVVIEDAFNREDRTGNHLGY